MFMEQVIDHAGRTSGEGDLLISDCTDVCPIGQLIKDAASDCDGLTRRFLPTYLHMHICTVFVDLSTVMTDEKLIMCRYLPCNYE